MKKRNEKLILFIFSEESKSIHRKEYFKNDFLYFCFYYFPGEFNHPLASFHFDYVETLESWTDVFFVWFRECAKSMFLTMYYVYIIVYTKRRFVMHYNSEIEQAKSMLRDVITILQDNEKLIVDFWYLYMPAEWVKRWNWKQKTVWEFITETGVKMKAMSVWKSPRWQKFVYKWVTYRPDLVWFDDLDNEKNTKNPDLIKADINFILWEVFWWVSSFAQKIFLWNVVNQDWRVPRLKKHFESDEKNKIKIFWIPIRIKWKISWNRFVATDKQSEQKNKGIVNVRDMFVSIEDRKREQWTIWFNQNYNLIAYKKWQKIIKDSDIKHYYKLPKIFKIVFWIDPAFSEKTWSDPIWLTVTAQEMYEKEIFKYVIEIKEFIEDEKDEERFCSVVVDMYHKYNCSLIYIEWNNGGLILARMLRKRWLSVIVVNAEKDKVTRLREYQWEFERGMIKFNPDDTKVWTWIQQLKDFPNVDHDDMVDSMVHSFTPFVWGTIRTF